MGVKRGLNHHLWWGWKNIHQIIHGAGCRVRLAALFCLACLHFLYFMQETLYYIIKIRLKKKVEPQELWFVFISLLYFSISTEFLSPKLKSNTLVPVSINISWWTVHCRSHKELTYSQSILDGHWLWYLCKIMCIQVLHKQMLRKYTDVQPH